MSGQSNHPVLRRMSWVGDGAALRRHRAPFARVPQAGRTPSDSGSVTGTLTCPSDCRTDGLERRTQPGLTVIRGEKKHTDGPVLVAEAAVVRLPLGGAPDGRNARACGLEGGSTRRARLIGHRHQIHEEVGPRQRVGGSSCSLHFSEPSGGNGVTGGFRPPTATRFVKSHDPARVPGTIRYDSRII